ncbi:hypothetical protein XENTR_v10014138 [Xenopus tropicalis]|nr:hypothetical protein XENTR_v10014138 [Xenopus tropicalis]
MGTIVTLVQSINIAHLLPQRTQEGRLLRSQLEAFLILYKVSSLDHCPSCFFGGFTAKFCRQYLMLLKPALWVGANIC